MRTVDITVVITKGGAYLEPEVPAVRRADTELLVEREPRAALDLGECLCGRRRALDDRGLGLAAAGRHGPYGCVCSSGFQEEVRY